MGGEGGDPTQIVDLDRKSKGQKNKRNHAVTQLAGRIRTGRISYKVPIQMLHRIACNPFSQPCNNLSNWFCGFIFLFFQPSYSSGGGLGIGLWEEAEDNYKLAHPQENGRGDGGLATHRRPTLAQGGLQTYHYLLTDTKRFLILPAALFFRRGLRNKFQRGSTRKPNLDKNV